jgi:DNA-binding transcriptional ArsR family regulator
MNVDPSAGADDTAATIAAAIGEPARARMLFCLVDGRARTATELALVAEVSPSTASAHLNRLTAHALVSVVHQGKHRYYRLMGAEVASVLEGLSVLAGRGPGRFVPNAADHLRTARTCYDHIAGTLGVNLHDRLMTLGWLIPCGRKQDTSYEPTPKGYRSLQALGIDLDAAHAARRRLAFACLDWTERRAHIGGALGAALLTLALDKKWVSRHRATRALHVTPVGRRAMLAQFGLPGEPDASSSSNAARIPTSGA